MQKKSSDEKLQAIHDILKKLSSTDLDFMNQIKQEPIEQEKDLDDFLTEIETTLRSIKRPTKVDVFTGILTALSALAMLHPKLGPKVSSKLNFAASFIHVLSGKDNKFVSEVTKSINSALTELADSELEEDAEGAKKFFRESFAFLNEKSPIKETDVSVIMTAVPIYSNTTFIGKLGKKIEMHNKSKDKNEALRAIRYTDLYVKLAVYGSCIILMLIKTILPFNEPIANKIFAVWKEREKTDKGVLKFLTKPEKSMALFFAFWYPSTTPKILMYLKHFKLELNLPNLCELSFAFQILDSESRNCFGMERRWRLFSSAVMEVCHANGKLNPSCDYEFYFESISEVDSIFHIRSMRKPHLYVYMEKGWSGQCYACKCEPGPQGQWKIIYLKNRKYILSTVMWPDWFLFGSSDSYGYPVVLPYTPPIVWTNCNLKGQKDRPSEFCINRGSYSK